MPHIVVKLWPGKSEKQKQQFAEAIVEQGMKTLGSGEGSFSVAFEEITPEEWPDKVYQPEIKRKWDGLYKKPEYTM